MTIGANDVIRAAVLLRSPAQDTIANIWHMKVNSIGAATQSEILLEIGGYIENIYQALEGQIALNWDADHIELFNVTKNIPEPAIPFLSFNGGTLNADSLPPGTCTFGFLRTGISRAIGKKFFPPPTENSSFDGVLAGAGLTALSAALDEVLDPSIVGALTDVVFGTRTGANPLSANVRPFISAVASSILAYQRRRKQGVGG